MVVGPAVTLSDGKHMPMVGLGTYARNPDTGQVRQSVENGIDAGYRHIDTASCYKNEPEVGQGIANKIKEGVVKREDLFVTTKLWNDCHAESDVVPALKESLSRLQLNYVDLYLVHWPFSVNAINEEANIDYIETWRGMEAALRLGLARSIGVSNFNIHQLNRLLQNCVVKPVVNQFEISPTLSQEDTVQYCHQHSVVPVAYTPLGLISEARPEFVGLDAIKTDPLLTEIAERHKKSKAQIALKWLIQRGIAVIPKSFTKSRIEENLKLFDFELSEEEMKVVNSLNINHRCVPATPFSNLKNYPF